MHCTLYLYTPGATLISLERAEEAHPCAPISNPAPTPLVHMLCVYMPAYIHYADDILVIRFTSTSLSTSIPRHLSLSSPPQLRVIIHRLPSSALNERFRRGSFGDDDRSNLCRVTFEIFIYFDKRLRLFADTSFVPKYEVFFKSDSSCK